MSHSLPYSIPYITAPTPQYMLSSHAHHAHVPGALHMVSPAQIRAEQPQRKRPKYTRSKTGCLTCRAKKIKCDEGKPNCHRCEHAHRECTWPDPAPPKKKTPARKNSNNQDPSSVAESASRTSGSITSRDATPNTRDNDSNANSAALNDSTRRYSGSQGYAYVESNAPMTNRQTDASYSAQGESASTAALGSASTFSNSYSYDFHHSPNGSLSSRSNSRPSTANSLPPSHFSAATNHAAIDSRDYPRWESIPSSRTEAAAYAYYSTA